MRKNESWWDGSVGRDARCRVSWPDLFPSNAWWEERMASLKLPSDFHPVGGVLRSVPTNVYVDKCNLKTNWTDRLGIAAYTGNPGTQEARGLRVRC